MESDIIEIVARIEGGFIEPDGRFEVTGVNLTDGLAYVTVRCLKKSNTDVLDLCQKLNGWSKDDYFSVKEIKSSDSSENAVYNIICKRIKEVKK